MEKEDLNKLISIILTISISILTSIIADFNMFLKLIILIISIVLTIICIIFLFIRLNLFNQIIKVLKNYEETQKDTKKEQKYLMKLGKNISELRKLGFKYKYPHNFKNDSYEIHITGEIPYISKFFIRKLENGKEKTPDEIYLSKGYSNIQRKQNNYNVLTDFIKYLKKIK